jgi:hypothetical protein
MAISITDADVYIAENCIDVEDWADSDEARKNRILNVAGRTLTSKYATYVIPDAAVYEFANVLSIAFNDTNRMQRQGINVFGLASVFNVGFKAELVTGPDADLSRLIPQSALDIIGAENGVKLSKRAVKFTVL